MQIIGIFPQWFSLSCLKIVSLKQQELKKWVQDSTTENESKNIPIQKYTVKAA